MKSKGRAGIFGVAAQRQHKGVAVDDPCGGREQRGVAVQRRLQRARHVTGEGLQVEHAIGFRVSPDRLQFCGFFRRGCDDQLAAIAMRDAVVAAIFIQRTLAADAHPRHQASRGIIDAGVDHFAVARRGDGADTFRRLQDDDLAAGLRQPPRNRKTDHPRTNDDALNFVHSRVQIRGLRVVRSGVEPRAGVRPGSLGVHYRSVEDDLFNESVRFLSACFPERIPVSEELIMSRQLP